MNNEKIDSVLNKIATALTIIGLIYIIFVITTATRKPGCTYTTQRCLRSHTDTTQRYWGRRWHDEEYEVCDEFETITHDCDCVTYHWFWGDVVSEGL